MTDSANLDKELRRAATLKIFLDTSALVALYNADDTYHKEARATMDMLNPHVKKVNRETV